MSKPKIGDKYIIEIDSHMTNKNGDLYGIKGFRSLVFDQNGLGRLTPYDADEVEREAYQRGLDDAWGAARKLVLAPDHGGYSWEELDKCFETYQHDSHACLEKTPAKEVVEKIREYEQRKAKEDAEIRVGDVVYNQNNYCYALVLKVYADDTALVMEPSKSGIMVHTPPLRALSKKNRHVDLIKLLGGEEEWLNSEVDE